MNDSNSFMWFISVIVLSLYLWLVMLYILSKNGRKVYYFIANPLDYIAFIRIIIREKSVINKIRYSLILLLQLVLFILFVWLIKSRF